jgi:hypothetical protein
LTRQAKNCLGRSLNLELKGLGELAELFPIGADPEPLHFGENRHQRQFNFVEDSLLLLFLKSVAHHGFKQP